MESHHNIDAELRGAGWGAFWWVLACVVTTLVVLTVVFFGPLRRLVFRERDPDATLAGVQGARMREIVRQIVAAHTGHIRKAVQEQKNTLAALEKLRDGRYQRYADQAERERKEGRNRPAPEPASVLGVAGPDTNIPLADKDFFELYAIAQTVERTTCGTYRQLRATELARVSGIALGEALDSTKIAIPTRPAINVAAFEQDITSGRDPRLKDLKDEVLKIRLEVEEMLASALHMLNMAAGIQTADVEGTRVYGAGGTFEGSGSGRWGSNVGPTLSPEEFFPGNTDGNFTDDFRPVWGRKLMDDGRQAEWMYIDTWYIIGPFPNPNRMNIDHPFPPEAGPGRTVDLDQAYDGLGGKKLQWKFRQSNSLMVVPHEVTNYAIWYAYTEIYADKPQERWVIFGSDDYSRVWLNGEPVYSSGVTPHKWIPDRGWRKLRFRQGFNRVLLKIENGPGTMGFSMAIYLGDVEASPRSSASAE